MEAAKALGKGKDANSGVFKIQTVAGAPPKAARHARRASQVPTAFSNGALPGQLPTMVEEDKADSQQAQQLQGADSIVPKTGEAALTPAQEAGSAGAVGSQDASGAAPASAPGQQPKKTTFVVSDSFQHASEPLAALQSAWPAANDPLHLHRMLISLRLSVCALSLKLAHECVHVTSMAAPEGWCHRLSAMLCIQRLAHRCIPHICSSLYMAVVSQDVFCTLQVKIKTALSGFLCCGRKSCRTVE